MEFIDLFKLIIKHYPCDKNMSKDRLVKMAYLCDWKSSLDNDRQITNVKWYINNYGPYIQNMYDILEKNKFNINDMLKTRKVKIEEADENVSGVIDFVVKIAKNLDDETVSNLVFSTFPLATSPKYDYVDLVFMSKEYKMQNAHNNKEIK